MRREALRALILLIAALLATPVMAGEEQIVLKDGAGRDVVEANCAACHSLDYIQMNSPFLDKAKWEATVKKMIDRFGAPIAEADAKVIIEYLTANYGPR
jgi:cytochrome c5